jgi:hypothetical protein
MRHPRLAGSLALAAGFVWLSVPPTPSAAQQSADAFRKEAKRPTTDIITMMPQFKDGSKAVDPKGPEGAKNVEALKQMAEYLVNPVTRREFFTTTIERKLDGGKKDLSLPERDKTLEGVLSELDRYVLVPEVRSKSPANQYEFIQEFGKALDAAITAILNDPANSPAPVKINAVRALAVACKSGAKAHAKTVTDLLTDPKRPLFLKYHALKAAENLLAAGDVLELGDRNPWKHSIPDADLAALVKAIEDIIVQMDKSFEAPPAPPAPPAAPTPPAKSSTPDPATAPAKGTTPPAKPAEQQKNKFEAQFVVDLDPEVALYIRKAAVRALSKVRVVSVAGPNKTIAARPGVILARIAAGDPWFTGGATATELADAVTGLANLNLDNTTNVDVLLDSIAAGVAGLGGEKVRVSVLPDPGKPDLKRLVPWKKTAAQVAAALASLRTSPDRNPVALANRAAIGNLVSTCTTYVLDPIEKEKDNTTNTPVNQAMVDDYRKQNARKSDLLIANDPESKVSLPNQRPAGR